MGSNSKGKDGERTSGVKKGDYDYEYEYDDEQHAGLFLLHNQSNVNTNGVVDPLVQLPLHGTRPYQPPPPLVLQQAAGLLQNGYVESVVHERLKSVRIRWNHAGTNIAIAGSWDNWETTEPLQNVGEYFVIVKTLPIGIYHYRFIVDGYFTHAPEFPAALHHSGYYAYNILDLQDYIPEALAKLSDCEDPPSPTLSYDNRFLNEDEFSKPPPELPPQLPVTIRQQEPSISNTHLELNHLYIHKTDGEEFVALRSTNRFQRKYVTTLLYKSLIRER